MSTLKGGLYHWLQLQGPDPRLLAAAALQARARGCAAGGSPCRLAGPAASVAPTGVGQKPRDLPGPSATPLPPRRARPRLGPATSGDSRAPILRGPGEPGGGVARGWNCCAMGEGTAIRRETKAASRFPGRHPAFPASSGWELRPHAVPRAARPPLPHSPVPGPAGQPGRSSQAAGGWPEGPRSPARGLRVAGAAAPAPALPDAPPGRPRSLPRAPHPARQAPGPAPRPHSPPRSAPAPRTAGPAGRAGGAGLRVGAGDRAARLAHRPGRDHRPPAPGVARRQRPLPAPLLRRRPLSARGAAPPSGAGDPSLRKAAGEAARGTAGPLPALPPSLPPQKSGRSASRQQPWPTASPRDVREGSCAGEAGHVALPTPAGGSSPQGTTERATPASRCY